MTEAATLLHLLRLPGIGPVGLRKIIARLDAMEVKIQNIFDLSVDQLAHDLHFDPEQISALHYTEADAEEDLDYCTQQGVQVLLSSDPDFPSEKLNVLGRGRPSLLFAKGNLDLLKFPGIGVSGARKAAEESLAQITHLCEEIAGQLWIIVSGGARGVDEAAHLAAIRSGPGTIIVLPTGILRFKARKELRKHFDEGKVLLLSEFPPEQGWSTGCAMQRNKITAALSHGLILVEPGAKGGTGGTGRIALKMYVPLYLLWNESTWGEGAEIFLRTGAQPIGELKQNIEELISHFEFRWRENQKVRKQCLTEDIFE
jgi:DNA processing protein